MIREIMIFFKLNAANFSFYLFWEILIFLWQKRYKIRIYRLQSCQLPKIPFSSGDKHMIFFFFLKAGYTLFKKCYMWRVVKEEWTVDTSPNKQTPSTTNNLQRNFLLLILIEIHLLHPYNHRPCGNMTIPQKPCMY